MKTGIGQSKYRNLTLFHVVWSVPAKVFLTVTFSIWSILTDYDLFGSDVEQDWSYTVFALFFFFFIFFIFFFFYLNSALFNRVYHIATTFYFACSKKGPATPPTHHTLFLDQTESFWNRIPLPLGLDDRTLPLYEGLDPSLLTSYQWMLWDYYDKIVTVWASGIWRRTRKVKICFHFKSDTSYSWVARDVTKNQTKKLSILLSFYFHEVLQYLNTFT